MRESEDLLEEAHTIVYDAVQDCLDRHVNGWGKIKNTIKGSLSDFLRKQMKRNPMILPIIMEVQQIPNRRAAVQAADPVRDTAVMKTPGRIRGMNYEQ